MHLRLLSLGYGNVGQAVARMLADKADALRAEHNLTLSYAGVYTRTGGAITFPEGISPAGISPAGISPAGISPADLAAAGWPLPSHIGERHERRADPLDLIRESPADVVLELTALNPRTGQPATDYIRAALAAGKHVVTANKGPIAYAYRELKALADERGVALRFESTVMDGTPLFAMAEAALPVTVVTGFRGLLNSTTNYVLSRMAAGESLEEGVAGAQRAGVAEADPSNDLDGWDGAVKATVLANVLMGADLRPGDVARVEVGAEAMRRMQAALPPGHTLKQVAEAERGDGGAVSARVALAALPPGDLLAHLSGMETAVLLHTDTMQDLTIVEGEGGPGQTAFGVVADLVTIARQFRPSVSASA
jgi:homoserine dehydrogenase